MIQLFIFISMLITGVIISRYFLNHELLIVLSVILIIGGFIGSIVTAIEKDITSEWVEKDVYVVKTPRLTIVDDGVKIWTFDKYEDVNNINDSTKFLFESTTNIFGVKRIEDIKYINKTK